MCAWGDNGSAGRRGVGDDFGKLLLGVVDGFSIRGEK